MPDDQGIFWLSSYPKSGNTWFRIVLANALNATSDPVDLNKLNTGAIASARVWIDEALGFDSADFSHHEIDQLRPLVYQWHGKGVAHRTYHKIHDAYTFLDNNASLIPSEGCLGALYFIRNPLDVAISFAHHSQCSIDKSIELMGNKKNAFCKNKHKQHEQLRQWLLSWSDHVRSWTTAEINVLVIRYEDMKQNTLATFTKAFEFLQLDPVQVNLIRALDNASIEKLQQQEKQFGFRERPSNVDSFFRKGVVGDWRDTLTPKQVERIIYDHGEVMQQYGYLDTNTSPV